MRALAALSILLGVAAAEEAYAHGGRGVRIGATGFEKELSLERVTDDALVPQPAGETARETANEGDAPRPATRGARDRDLANNVRASDYDWRQWWAVNRWSVLPGRAAIRKRRARWEIQAGAKPPDLGKRNRTLREDRRNAANVLIVPALLAALDPEKRESDAVRAAALIALGKCARDVEHVELLWDYAQDAKQPPLIRRCAAISIGLLRRTRPEDRFRPELLDVMRRRLFSLFDEDEARRTTRAFAMYAVGLLADQPYSKATLEGRVVARELWKRLDHLYRTHDLPVALLTALGMQSLHVMPAKRGKELKRIVEGNWVQKHRWNHYERGHAMTAQAKLRAHEWHRLVWYINSTQRSSPTFIRMSTFNALYEGVANVPDDYRKSMAISLIVSMRAARNTLTRGLAHVAMARLLNEDLRRGSEKILEDTRAFKWLVAEARDRGEYYYVKASFAALGVGLAAQGLGHDVEKGEALRLVAARALKNILKNDKLPLFRASCVAALGCAEHEEGVEPLVRLLRLTEQRGRLPRYFAPVALGQIGCRKPLVMNGLRGAISRQSSSAELRSQVLLAQVMLGDPGARSLLLRELALTTSTWAAAQVVLAIGLHDDLTMVRPILQMATDRKRSDDVRAYAYAALGFLGDPEEQGSILKLLIGANYPLRTWASTELYSIL